MNKDDPTAAGEEDRTSPEKCTRYFIGGLQRHISTRDVEEYFGHFGDVKNFILRLDSAGNSRGFGWVIFRKPPLGVQRPEPHYLRGVKLTVEPALSKNKLERRAANGEGSNITRRRRQRSESGSFSDSSSSAGSVSSSGGRRGGTRYYTLPGERHNDNSRRAPFPSGSSRLPPLPSDTFAQASLVPPPKYDESPSFVSKDTPNSSTGDTYLCIPLALCPPEFVNDPRTFCARLDQSRIGGLSIVPSPVSVSGPVVSSLASAASHHSHPPPPPPGPPNQHHRGQPSRGTGRGSSSSGLPTVSIPQYDSATHFAVDH
uniref:Putative RNA-binding protein n=1 Tax=Trypanosoma congolense (strain IL3000) TaxID=1068625 RepID=G0UR38_TRYCI|nr:putative RNA-binding protein [Trypanosoma congolense IL3000]